MVAAFAAAARLGVMIKQTSYLEASANVNTVVMDKTGTITTGSFEVSRLAPAEGVEGAELLTAAATAEQSSNHPLAQSILKTSRAARVQPGPVQSMEEFHGRGVSPNSSSIASAAAINPRSMAARRPARASATTLIPRNLETM